MVFFYFYLTEILLFYTVILDTSARRQINSFRVIGGRDVSRPGDFPYVVRVEKIITKTSDSRGIISSSTNEHRCTASVLSPTASLTAAHCCQSEGVETIVIRYGSAPGKAVEVDKFSEVLSCVEIQKPRDKTNPIRKYELVLMATQPITLIQYARISAVDHTSLYGQRVTIHGYGYTIQNGSSANTLNLQIPLQVSDAMWSKCNFNVDNAFDSEYPLVCAMAACGRYAAVCQGDAGSPVMHDSAIVGITTSAFKGNCQMRSSNVLNPIIGFVSPLSINIDWIADGVAEIQSNK